VNQRLVLVAPDSLSSDRLQDVRRFVSTRLGNVTGLLYADVGKARARVAVDSSVFAAGAGVGAPQSKNGGEVGRHSAAKPQKWPIQFSSPRNAGLSKSPLGARGLADHGRQSRVR
jgi:hypothetical protein